MVFICGCNKKITPTIDAEVTPEITAVSNESVTSLAITEAFDAGEKLLNKATIKPSEGSAIFLHSQFLSRNFLKRTFLAPYQLRPKPNVLLTYLSKVNFKESNHVSDQSGNRFEN